MEMIPEFKDLVGGAELELVLNTGRTMKQGNVRHEKLTEEYKKATSVAMLSKEDMEAANLRDGDVVLVESAGGDVKIIAETSKYVDQGIIFIPLGPYANALIPRETKDGSPFYKSLRARVKRADEKPTEWEDLFK
jgi:formylmethanofuran dehydrogenase subunit D